MNTALPYRSLCLSVHDPESYLRSVGTTHARKGNDHGPPNYHNPRPTRSRKFTSVETDNVLSRHRLLWCDFTQKDQDLLHPPHLNLSCRPLTGCWWTMVDFPVKLPLPHLRLVSVTSWTDTPPSFSSSPSWTSSLQGVVVYWELFLRASVLFVEERSVFMFVGLVPFPVPRSVSSFLY